MSSVNSHLTDVYENPTQPTKRPNRGTGVPQIKPYSIPRDKFECALALLNAPRVRPPRRLRESHLNDPPKPTTAPAVRRQSVCILPDGRIESGSRVLRRCHRIHQRTVHHAHDDAKLDGFQPTDLSAMLCTISACVSNEDWRHAVEIISMASQRPQSFQSRLTLFRLAFVTLIHDPVLLGTGLLESFVQGVLDCRDDAEIDNFLQMCSQLPPETPPGDLNVSELRRQHSDRRLTAMLDQSIDYTKNEVSSDSVSN